MRWVSSPAARTTRARLRLAACALAALLAASCSWQGTAGDEPAPSSPIPVADRAVAPTDPMPTTTQLGADSTLAQWRTATTSARSQLAVALARQRLAPDASKLEVASTAMEISGCLTATARDSRFDAWPLAPTAATCLTPPQRPAK